MKNFGLLFAVLFVFLTACTSAVTPSTLVPTNDTSTSSPANGGSYSISLPPIYIQGFENHWANMFISGNQINGGIALVVDVVIEVDAQLNPIQVSLALQEIWATDLTQFHPDMGIISIEVFGDMMLVGGDSEVTFSDGTVLHIPEVTLPAGLQTFSSGMVWIYPMDSEGTPLKTDQRAFQA